MKILTTVIVAALLAVPASAVQTTVQRGSSFHVTLTNEGYWLTAYCRLDIEAGGAPGAVSEPVEAELECGRSGRTDFIVTERLTPEEVKRFSTLSGNQAIWKGPADGRDVRFADGHFERLEIQSDHLWSVAVTSGSTSFQLEPRSNMLNLLTAIRDRMERRGRGNSITGSATRRETQAAPPSGVQGTWFVRAEVQELTPNSPRLDQLMIGLKADGAKVIGWLLYGAQPAPITDGKIEGNAVTFKVDGRLAGTYTAKLEGDRLVLRTTTGPLSSRALTAVRYRVGRDQ